MLRAWAFGYARADVTGVVRIDRPRRRASVELTVVPGPRCVFGRVHVVGAEPLPVRPIRAATLIEPGDPYRAEDIADAQDGVYGLGAFASVLVEPIVPAEGNVVDVRVTVSPARRQRLGLGVGVQSGVIEAGQGIKKISVPQWELHLRRCTHGTSVGCASSPRGTAAADRAAELSRDRDAPDRQPRQRRAPPAGLHRGAHRRAIRQPRLRA
jgi:hypothetical protein